VRAFLFIYLECPELGTAHAEVDTIYFSSGGVVIHHHTLYVRLFGRFVVHMENNGQRHLKTNKSGQRSIAHKY
jgi:hypothetical protein